LPRLSVTARDFIARVVAVSRSPTKRNKRRARCPGATLLKLSLAVECLLWAVRSDPLMCNLYSMTKTQEAVRRLFRVSSNRAAAFEPKDAIFPAHKAPVVRRAEDGERELLELSWGFVLPQPGKAPRRVTKTRDDKMQSAFWCDSVRKRWCLVPVSSFCEPNGDVKPATWTGSHSPVRIRDRSSRLQAFGDGTQARSRRKAPLSSLTSSRS
jgi:putative SOS response-associated peptidase YedK